MNLNIIDSSSISCNCFSNNYQIKSNAGLVNNNIKQQSHHFSTTWQQKLLVKMTEQQDKQAQKQASILQKLKKKSLKRQTCFNNSASNKNNSQSKNISRPQSSHTQVSNNKYNSVQKNQSAEQKQFHKKQKYIYHPSSRQIHPTSHHILFLSKHNPHSLSYYKNSQNHNTLEASAHNKYNFFPENYQHLVYEKSNNKFQNITNETHKVSLMHNNVQNQYKKQVSQKLHKQHQQKSNLSCPNSAHRTPRKTSIKQQIIEIANIQSPLINKAPRISYKASNGSLDPKASKKYSLVQSTANKTLMKPKQIQSVLDSNQNDDDRFSQVIMNMDREEEIYQIQKLSAHEAIKAAFMMKGTMIGTNATQSCVENCQSIQFQ